MVSMIAYDKKINKCKYKIIRATLCARDDPIESETAIKSECDYDQTTTAIRSCASELMAVSVTDYINTYYSHLHTLAEYSYIRIHYSLLLTFKGIKVHTCILINKINIISHYIQFSYVIHYVVVFYYLFICNYFCVCILN